jgi:hexosaminidase
MKLGIRSLPLAAFWSFLLIFSINLTTVAQIAGFDARSIEVAWHLIRNNHPGANQFTAALTFRSSGKSLPRKGWSILFNLRYHGTGLTSNTPAFTIEHIGGDLFSIRPTDSFNPPLSGQAVTMEYWGNRLVANFQDVPTGLIWIDDAQPEVGIDMMRAKITNSTEGSFEKLPDADPSKIFAQNKAIQDIPVEQLPKIFPSAMEYWETAGTFSLDEGVQIISEDLFANEAKYLSKTLEQIVRKKIPVNGSKKPKTIVLKSAKLSPEAYRLRIQTTQILVEGGDAAGIFYGIQSIKSMLPADAWHKTFKRISLPCVEVNDAPRFPFRAFMLDVARNFQSKNEILKVLELMSLYKLNVFHFHLNDDEGWRLEIPGLPELTDVGARRGFPFKSNAQLHPSYGSGAAGKQGDGFYSKSDYLEILRYATERHIRVVPEIESPAHARAAIKAMQYRHEKFHKAGNVEEANRYVLQDLNDESTYLSSQYFKDNVMDVALPSTYVFIEKVIDEIMIMHREAGAPLAAIHMAGDEVPHGSWEKSPTANAFMQSHPQITNTKDLWRYYFNEVNTILQKKGLGMYGWQELVMGTQNADASAHSVDAEFLNANVQVDAWWNLYGSEDVPYKLANTGYKTVLTCFDHFYFDLAYQNSFDEPGDGWIGFLDIDKTYSFIPYDYYKNSKTNIRGEPLPNDFFKGKEGLTEKGKQNIVGIQGALWGENLVSSELMEYLLMPRLMALAERAWAQDPDWSREDNPSLSRSYLESWSTFCNVLGKRELPKLDYYNGGFGYRIPTPGVEVSNGKVKANFQLPGFTIRYTLDGSEPNAESEIYSHPFESKGTIKLCAFDRRGRKGKTVMVKNQ